MDKSGYYHSSKTQLKIQLETRFMSKVERVSPTNPKKIKNNQNNLILTKKIIKKSQQIFDWVKSS
jgi:hypothetical protein